mgnify:CR=1 FL=1
MQALEEFKLKSKQDHIRLKKMWFGVQEQLVMRTKSFPSNIIEPINNISVNESRKQSLATNNFLMQVEEN